MVLRRFFVSTALVPLVFDGDGDDDNGSGDSGAAVRTPLRFEDVPAALLAMSLNFFLDLPTSSSQSCVLE